jgi:hypothetical protein
MNHYQLRERARAGANASWPFSRRLIRHIVYQTHCDSNSEFPQSKGAKASFLHTLGMHSTRARRSAASCLENAARSRVCVGSNLRPACRVSRIARRAPGANAGGQSVAPVRAHTGRALWPPSGGPDKLLSASALGPALAVPRWRARTFRHCLAPECDLPAPARRQADLTLHSCVKSDTVLTPAL